MGFIMACTYMYTGSFMHNFSCCLSNVFIMHKAVGCDDQGGQEFMPRLHMKQMHVLITLLSVPLEQLSALA